MAGSLACNTNAEQSQQPARVPAARPTLGSPLEYKVSHTFTKGQKTVRAKATSKCAKREVALENGLYASST